MRNRNRSPFLVRPKFLAALALFLAIPMGIASPLWAGEAATQTLEPLATITVAEAKEKLTYLASDALAGRRAGTDGAKLAADYIASTFKKAGLAPGGTDGSYLRQVVVPPATLPGTGNVLIVKGVNKSFEMTPMEDFVPFGFSPSAKVPAGVVFAGYGLTMEGWNDYEGINVEGKIVLVLRHGPGWKESGGRRSKAARQYTFHAKARAAQEQGAVGLILVSDPASLKGKDRLAFLAGGGSGIRIPCVHAAMCVGEALLRLVGDSLKERQEKMDRQGKSLSSVIPAVKVELATSVVRGRPKCFNVIGILKGADAVLSKECIVVGAHYDSLGFGDVGALAGKPGRIFPGADDNGSGTVGVMEVAEAFSALPFRPRRSLVFICFTAEEVGLYGSRAFASKPPFPRAKTVAMLNMDMISRGRPNRLGISGVGTAEIFESMIRKANKEVGIQLRLGKFAGGGSDHASFYARRIPVLFFYTGGNPDYHRPSDTVDKVNFDNLTKTAKLVYLVAARLSAVDDKPAFVALKRPPRQTRKGVRLGFYPDNWYDGKGALIEAISPDTPADRAGLKAGDIILEFGGKKLESINELRTMLSETKPGSSVKLVYLRNGKTHTVTVRFK
ncbi:MAG: M20/M25/M40 family metallo-hydrolase [Planctomycetota bacterium]|jgi:hypothetical protein